MKLKLKFLPRKPNGKTAEKVIGIKIHHLRYSIFPHFSNEVSLMGDTSREDPPLAPLLPPPPGRAPEPQWGTSPAKGGGVGGYWCRYFNRCCDVDVGNFEKSCFLLNQCCSLSLGCH